MEAVASQYRRQSIANKNREWRAGLRQSGAGHFQAGHSFTAIGHLLSPASSRCRLAASQLQPGGADEDIWVRLLPLLARCLLMSRPVARSRI